MSEEPTFEDQDQALWKLVYASAATEGFTSSDLDAILHVARTHNAEVGVTGMLLYVNPSFLQVLEGPDDRIHGLYDHIKTDRRHDRVLLLLREPIEQRSFADWTMGSTTATLRDLQDAVAVNGFFEHEEPPLHNLTDSKLSTLLDLFRSGSYRQRIA
jgi:hypothetical protein